MKINSYALIFAGGSGARMGSDLPKQFLEVDNKAIIIHTIEKFENNPNIEGIIIVCKEDYISYCKELIKKFNFKKVFDVIEGGKTGQESIFNGLNYLYKNKSKEAIVLIHDGVRPVIDDDLINSCIECTNKNGNAISASKAIETIIKIDTSSNQILETVDRNSCRYAKAPQSFYLKDIYKAHLKAIEEKKDNIIDSATMMSIYGHKLYTVETKAENIKITTPNDYYMFKALYESKKESL